MITLSTILNSGGSLPDDVDDNEAIEDGINNLSKALNKLMNVEGGQFHWKQEMDLFYKSWSKLVSGSKDSVQGTDMSFEQLNNNCTKIVMDGNFPAVIT